MILKPCPFCGGEAAMGTRCHRGSTFTEKGFVVTCADCGATNFGLGDVGADTERDAGARWNIRAVQREAPPKFVKAEYPVVEPDALIEGKTRAEWAAHLRDLSEHLSMSEEDSTALNLGADAIEGKGPFAQKADPNVQLYKDSHERECKLAVEVSEGGRYRPYGKLGDYACIAATDIMRGQQADNARYGAAWNREAALATKLSQEKYVETGIDHGETGCELAWKIIQHTEADNARLRIEKAIEATK